jgi:hypothetical protein
MRVIKVYFPNVSVMKDHFEELCSFQKGTIAALNPHINLSK